METKDLIGEIVNGLSAEIKIISAGFVGSDIEIKVECPFWLFEGDVYDWDGGLFRVMNIKKNTVLLRPLDGAVPSPNTFVIKPPAFFNGTYKMVKNEVNRIMDKEKITPMVWLREVIDDNFTVDTESMIDRDSTFEIYFVASADYSNWLYNDHYEKVIYPLARMVREFVLAMQKNRFIGDDFIYTKNNLINLSVAGEQEESVFDLNLTGISLDVTAQIRKDLFCEGIC